MAKFRAGDWAVYCNQSALKNCFVKLRAVGMKRCVFESSCWRSYTFNRLLTSIKSPDAEVTCTKCRSSLEYMSFIVEQDLNE